MSDTHESVAPLLSAYLDGELDADQRSLVAAHLPGCAICGKEMAMLHAADEALSALPPPPRAPDMRSELRRRLRRQGARTGLATGLLLLEAVTARSLIAEMAIVRRKDLPPWFRFARGLSGLLILYAVTSLIADLLRDIRRLQEYGWLSGDTTEKGQD